MAVEAGADLYGLPLEEFVPARAALTKQLRSGGHRDEAAAVAKLRKPSVAAWTVNQLARSHAKLIGELFAAGEALELAQADLLAGRGDPRKLRTATARERELVDQLTTIARDLLSSAGGTASAGTLERVAETLHAAALEAEVRGEVRAGRLEHELRHVGLGSGTVVPAPATPREQHRGDHQRAERERRRRIEAAREAEAKARRAAEGGARRLEDARRRRDSAAAALREAEEAVGRAGAEAEQAQAAHDAARQALGNLAR